MDLIYIRGCCDRGNFGCYFSHLLVSTLLQGKRVMGGDVILVSQKDHFIKVSKNRVQHPSNYLSFCLVKWTNKNYLSILYYPLENKNHTLRQQLIEIIHCRNNPVIILVKTCTYFGTKRQLFFNKPCNHTGKPCTQFNLT